MKKYYTLLFFLLFVNLGFSQNKEIDSLRLSLKNTSIADTTKINVYIHLTQLFGSISLDSFSKYTELSMQLSLKRSLHKLPRIYSNKGLQCIYYSKVDSARYYFDQALILLDKKDNKKIRAAVYSNYGMSYQNTNDLDKKSEYNLKTILLLDDNPYNLSLALYNQGIIYGQSELWKQAKKYFHLAYKTSLKGKNKRSRGLSLMGLGHIYMDEKKLDSAKIYLEKGLELCEQTKNPQICFEIKNKLGLLFDELKIYDKAHDFLVEANKIALKRKVNQDIVNSLINLGYHELKQENYLKAIIYYKKMENSLNENSKSILAINSYKFWSQAESKLGNFKKSNSLLEKYTLLKDSLFTKKNRNIIVDAEAKYETEKKDKEIIEQQLQLEEHKTQLQKNKTQFFYMAGGALLLLVSSILLWFLYQQRQKRKNQEILTLKREHQVQTLESLMEGEEKERFRIAKELHDGVNGDLSAIKFKLSSLLEMNNTVIKEAVTMIDKSCQQVRAISHNLVPPSLQDFNLIEALEEYCTNMNAIHSPEISFQQLGDAIVLNKKQEANIFRIVQELVNNSIKHAKADEINVQISSRENTIQLTVEDNGKGYDKETIKTDGIGLKNIQSRVDYLNASLDLVSNTQGTSTTIEIDLNKLN